MATTVTVSGTRVQSPQGSNTISAPGGSVTIGSTNTNITGNTQVGGNTNIAGSAAIGGTALIGGATTILSTATSTSTNQGALVVSGGVGIAGNIRVASTATSTNSTSGAAIIGGGVGIGGNINVDGYANIGGPLNVANSATITGTITVVGNSSTVIIQANDNNVGNPFNIAYTNTNVYGSALERLQGAMYIAGGVGIEKDLNVGGFIYGRIAQANTASTFQVTATNVDEVFYPTFAKLDGSTGTVYSPSYIDNVSSATNTSTGGLTYNPYQGKLSTDNLLVASSATSTSTDTGALQVNGGVGIKGDVHIGGAEYVDNLYTKIIASTEGPIEVRPEGSIVDIFGNIRVRGDKPIGTAPVVTNTLYVTMDGDDTNDGRAQDASRACRTIGGAMKSPYYQPGTQIRVTAGHYYEDNPLVMQPYTSVMGSDIRTTEIEPINKTQDLFHVNSGCYLAFMQFCQGRSGLLPGNYESQYNRGAYATAFPPQTGDNRIDLFHSPYIQNCTNLSGPWLKDGTLFNPSQTVQVPIAVATGTWAANTTSIVLSLDTSVSTGTIVQGMHVVQGQQNPGFFSARTLLLANKPFLQAQVVSYVEKTFNSGSFVYNQASCFRDTGLILDSIAMDMLYNTDSESTFAGLQYWNQGISTEGVIPGEFTTTTNAISHALDLAIAVANSADPSGDSANVVSNNFNTILSIIFSGPDGYSGVAGIDATNPNGVSNNITPNGLPSTTTATINAYNALLSAKDSIAAEVITWINSNNPNFVYNETTCARDITYIIQSVAFDLLHGGNKQSIKSGTYYFGYNSASTAVPDEIPQTNAAYNYIKAIIPSIVTGKKLTTQYSNGTQIISGYDAATQYEVDTLQAKIDLITNIVANGPSVAGPQIPMPSRISGNIEVINAFNLLEANRVFIQNEIIAYINSQFNSFEYNKQLCYRDTGIIVENVTYDAVFGGNEKSVQAGLAYYKGVTSIIAGQESQTISAIQYLQYLCEKVIRNEVCPVLPAVYGIPQANQVINTVMLGGSVISDSIKELFGIITTVIANGPDTAPTIYNTPGPDAAYLSAEVLMQANRKFIQEDTINWINNTFIQFPYSKIKCKRDVGIILDSVIGDVLFPTTTFSQSTFAGLQYWSQGGLVDLIPDQINQTVDAVTYLRDLSVKIIQNITPADDLIARYQTGVSQVTNLPAATAGEAATIIDHYNNIISILKGNKLGWTDKFEFGRTLSKFISVQNAYALLQANSAYMKAEVIAYINSINPGFSGTYNSITCQRDVGYINDSVSFDLKYGGNKQSIQAGLSYYAFSGTESTIRAQEIQTTNAFSHMAEITSLIIQNIPVVALQSKVKQVTSLNTSTLAIANVFTQAYTTVTNIITNGPSVAADLTPISLVETAAPEARLAVDILEANRAFIVAEVIQFIDNTYNSTVYSYNTTTCYRDTGLIIDSIAMDMLYNSTSDSEFAGLQYWKQSSTTEPIIPGELTTTTNAIGHANTLAIATLTDSASINKVNDLFAAIIEIINVGPDAYGGTGITNNIIANELASTTATIVDSYNAIQSAKASIQASTVQWIDANNPGFNYNTDTCYRDLGFILDSVCFDLLHGGNKQSIKSGAYYYGYVSTSSQIATEQEEVSAAYEFIAERVRYIVTAQPVPQTFQKNVSQYTFLPAASDDEVAILQNNINVITDIITFGPEVAGPKTPIGLNLNSSNTILNAYNLLMANRTFLQEEVIAFINATYTGNRSFSYNEELCYRDTGLIVDAVSQDILLGGNLKSVEAGLSYWNQGYNYVTGQESTTTMAINHARDIALKVIANQAVTPQPQTETKQVINTFYQYGGDYMPSQSVRRNFNIITDLIERGPLYAPILYPGSGLANATGLNALDNKISPTVTSISSLGGNKYLVGISTSTVGFGINATLYFGDIAIFPKQDYQVEELALQYTGNASSWDMRKVDSIGGMGGSLVDGAVISDRSPINSFVYDAFTQLTQGGRGVRITNNGYAQLVSVFTIFSSVGVQVDNGGIGSIVNSNANFGDICLVAKGYGTRKFSGTVYNPAYKAYPDSPGVDGLNQYYPNGFWPRNGEVEIFLPDIADRPGTSLVMEVVPPVSYVNYTGNEVTFLNNQGYPGFLNAQPSTSTLTVGSITISGIDITGVSIGNNVYIRDQFGYEYDHFPYLYNQFGEYVNANGDVTTNSLEYIVNPNYNKRYAAVGTVVKDVEYQTVTLDIALPGGGGFVDNPNFFNVYFCGNAYYTVLSSTVATNPKTTGTNILSTDNPNITVDQVQAHVDSILFLNELVDNIVGNTPVRSIQTSINSSTQTFLPTVTGGAAATEFIDLRFGETVSILGSTPSQYNKVVPQGLIKKTGTVPQGAGSAITLIEANKTFLQDEVAAFVEVLTNTSTFVYDETLCRRDLGLVLNGTFYDIALGTNYNAVTSGLAYNRGNALSTQANELVQTVSAFDYAQQEAASYLTASSTAKTRSNKAFTEIKSILINGTSVADAIVFPAPTTASTATVNAVTQLTANKIFLQSEVLAWLDLFHPEVSFNHNTCARDMGYIIDAICYDVMYGGNSASIINARAYFDTSGTILIGAGEYAATSDAYDYLSTIAQQIILGDVVSVTEGNTVQQARNGNYGSSTETAKVSTNLSIIKTVIDNQSLSSLPAVVNPSITWADAAIQTAANNLATHKSSIINNTIGFINISFTGQFVYDQSLCYRDTGLIVDAIAQDLLFQGTSQSTFAGIQYWGQSGSAVPGEVTTTTNAIAYISDLAQRVIQNDLGGTRYTTTATQNTTLPAASSNEAITIGDKFTFISSILNATSLVGLTDTIEPNGLTASGDEFVQRAYALLQANKDYLKAQAVAYVEATKTGGFTYDQGKCSRDIGYMVDSVSVDLLYGGNRQSFQSGVYYWNYDSGSTRIPNEIPQTTKAYAHIKDMLPYIVKGLPVPTTYQSTATQITAMPVGTNSEVTAMQAKIDVITGIIIDGPTGVTKTAINPVASTNQNIVNAAKIVEANRDFIQLEVIAYIDSTSKGPITLTPSQRLKCQRDTGIILQRLIYDLETGGNYNSVQSGLSYWARNGTHHIVQLGENVTDNALFPDGATVNFYQRSYISASGYVFEYVGAGTNYGALPQFGQADPVQSKEVVQLDGGKVFFTSTDQNGDFRIGPGLVISQATGVLSGRTFTKSLFANMTPFILAIEAGGGF